MKHGQSLALFVTLILAGHTFAADTPILGGALHFSTPDNWQLILQTDGETESRVFKVPDPSPTGTTSLARVQVTAHKVDGIDQFQVYVSQAVSKASSLVDYHPGNSVHNNKSMDSAAYTAREDGVLFTYTESYWYKDGYALQLRCVRPAQSQAGAAWQAQFDANCTAIARQLAG